jgi:uncharacterized protein YwqG
VADGRNEIRETTEELPTQAAALRPGSADRRLILQIVSDEHAGWMWGDGGTLYVWMREQDVRARRFDSMLHDFAMLLTWR